MFFKKLLFLICDIVVFQKNCNLIFKRTCREHAWHKERTDHTRELGACRALGLFPFLKKKPGNPGLGIEWNRHFPEFHSEILGVPREVSLKFRKIGITGKFRSIRPFLLGPSFSEPGNRNSTWLILELLNIILVLYQTND